MANPPTKTAQKASSRPSQRALNHLRIIGGSWRGRKLSFPDVEGLRPTGDRIRETLFNWLAPEMQGARVLDVFAGSGALGLEALSRGASFSLLLERDQHAAKALADNLALLKAEHGRLLQLDSLRFLQAGNVAGGASGAPYEPFDVVFIDPPFSQDLWQAVIAALETQGWLSAEASIYVETPRHQPCPTPAYWQLHRDKQAGQVSYRLFYRQQGEDETP